MNPAIAGVAANPEIGKIGTEVVKAVPGVIDSVQARQERMAKWIFIGIAVVIGIILLIIYGPKLVRWLSRGAEAINMGAMAAGISKQNLSYPENQYQLFADKLHFAMDGAGTDEEAIYQVFRAMNNYDDVSQLIVSYGNREITDPRPWVSNENLTLSGALKNELDESELKTVNTIMAGKGIKYAF